MTKSMMKFVCKTQNTQRIVWSPPPCIFQYLMMWMIFMLFFGPYLFLKSITGIGTLQYFSGMTRVNSQWKISIQICIIMFLHNLKKYMYKEKIFIKAPYIKTYLRARFVLYYHSLCVYVCVCVTCIVLAHIVWVCVCMCVGTWHNVGQWLNTH